MTLLMDQDNENWVEIGRTTTSPIEDTKRKEVVVDSYYLVVGFEVNENAFVGGVFDLNIDPGHAFFYAVKNNIVICSFSFGPGGEGDTKIGWMDKGEENPKYQRGAILKDGILNSRPGTADYPIPEMTRSFKMPLTPRQAMVLSELVDKFRRKCDSGEKRYVILYNDTCAEEARDILSAAGISTPSGSSKIKHSGVSRISLLYAVNPYAWHSRFVSEGRYTEIRFAKQDQPWVAEVGTEDPIESHRERETTW